MIQKRIRFVCQCLSFLFLILGYSEKLRASFGCHSGDRKKKRIKCIIQVPNGNLQEWVLQLTWKEHFIAYSLNKGHLQRPSPELESGKTKTMGALQTDFKNPLNRYQINFLYSGPKSGTCSCLVPKPPEHSVQHRLVQLKAHLQNGQVESSHIHTAWGTWGIMREPP